MQIQFKQRIKLGIIKLVGENIDDTVDNNMMYWRI